MQVCINCTEHRVEDCNPGSFHLQNKLISVHIRTLCPTDTIFLIIHMYVCLSTEIGGNVFSHYCLCNTFVGEICYIYPALDLFFINDTPRLRGGDSGSISAQFATNRQNIQMHCRLKRYERGRENCMYNFLHHTNP